MTLARDRQIVILGRQHVADHLRERARDLDAGRAAAHDDEVQRAFLDQSGVAIGLLEHPEDARAQSLRVLERVQGKRVLVGAGGVEEVGLGPGGQDQGVARLSLARRAIVTAWALGSTAATSAILTSTLGSLRNTLRIEFATSLGASWEVATWYSSGRNWW